MWGLKILVLHVPTIPPQQPRPRSTRWYGEPEACLLCRLSTERPRPLYCLQPISASSYTKGTLRRGHMYKLRWTAGGVCLSPCLFRACWITFSPPSYIFLHACIGRYPHDNHRHAHITCGDLETGEHAKELCKETPNHALYLPCMQYIYYAFYWSKNMGTQVKIRLYISLANKLSLCPKFYPSIWSLLRNLSLFVKLHYTGKSSLQIRSKIYSCAPRSQIWSPRVQ